ncbi:MAG: sensor histidine kinase [Treponema sp.]|jgi:two-component system sensor histidine kinase HydH|nr:sensor histidine kinase [Treponema sp.]
MKMKVSVAASSGIAAVLGWLILSALLFFIVWAMLDRARLIRDNDNERILNTLFTSLRNYDDFGSAIESNEVLAGRIRGFAVYGDDLRTSYECGKVPPVFDESMLGGNQRQNRFGRYTIPDPQGRSVKFVLGRGRMNNTEHSAENHPPPPGRPRGRRMDPPPFFSTLFRGKYIYIDVAHPAYWRTRTLSAIIVPAAEIILLLLVFAVRRLYLRNREYRGRIEAQKNLVVLGTAAGTLAHEIKNPLLSIRLQTGILEKSLEGGGKEEIALINQEVERLSSLIYRVNDYLREERGNPVPLNVYDLLAETSRRLCGRCIIGEDSARDVLVMADRDRFRSVFENLIRNALESGGDEKETGASISRNRNSVRRNGARRDGVLIRIYDRGRGIAPRNLSRVFDPFFTSKSTGTGIGLSVGRRFIEAAGGTITLENREGGGAEASISIAEYTGGDAGLSHVPKEDFDARSYR